MNIFVIFLLLIGNLLGLKNKVYIYLKFDNFETYIKIKNKFINIERKGSFVKKNKKYNLDKKNNKIIRKISVDRKRIIENLKNIEVEELNINVLFGAILLFPTIYAIPIISTLLEHIKMVPFKKLKNYKYMVIPVYEEPKLTFEVSATLKIRIFDLLKIGLISLKG